MQLAPHSNLPSQEKLFLDYVQRVERHRADRYAIHLHLSKLRPHHRREHHIRIAIDTFEDMVKNHEGQIFRMANADVVFIGKGTNHASLDEAIRKLRYIFGDDPLIQNEDASNPFTTWYALDSQWDELHTVARNFAAGEQMRAARAAAPVAPAPELKPITTDQLHQIEQTLARADLSNLIRRQPAVVIQPGADPSIAFHELFVSIADLQNAIAPNTNLASSRALFQHLTQTLDRRTLATLSRTSDSGLRSRFSLNINVATILSQEFLTFDRALRAEARGTIVLELQIPDVMSDPEAFCFARDFARERSYRICLDGITPGSANLVRFDTLGADLVKLIWSPELGDGLESKRANAVRELVAQLPGQRVILARCDTDGAIEIGHKLGINVFQGRRLDELLRPASAPIPRPRSAKR